MTFNKSRFMKNKNNFELVRFCNLQNHTIIGSASKLLKYFENNYAYENLISYADRRWSNGNLYEKLNFSLSHISKPNYWYFKTNTILSRYQCQKHKLSKILDNFNNQLTEKQNMINNNFRIFYDCGNLVYIKKQKQ